MVKERTETYGNINNYNIFFKNVKNWYKILKFYS